MSTFIEYEGKSYMYFHQSFVISKIVEGLDSKGRSNEMELLKSTQFNSLFVSFNIVRKFLLLFPGFKRRIIKIVQF